MNTLTTPLRLIAAELRKLNRPMTWALGSCAVVFGVLIAWAEAYDVSQHPRYEALPHITAGADAAAHLSPLAAGAFAAGLMASLPGAVLIALLAGGHVGGEWTGRTIKNLLSHHGARFGIVTAKVISLWLAGAAMLAAGWVSLAAAGPLLAGWYRLPDPHQPLSAAAGLGFSQAARALLVLAAFVALAVLAAVVTRSLIGTVAAVVGAVVGMLLLGAQPGIGAFSPATWVQGWMGYAPQRQTMTSHFWSTFTYPNVLHPGQLGSMPSQTAGLIGLVGLVGFCAILATAWFHWSDITV